MKPLRPDHPARTKVNQEIGKKEKDAVVTDAGVDEDVVVEPEVKVRVTPVAVEAKATLVVVVVEDREHKRKQLLRSPQLKLALASFHLYRNRWKKRNVNPTKSSSPTLTSQNS